MDNVKRILEKVMNYGNIGFSHKFKCDRRLYFLTCAIFGMTMLIMMTTLVTGRRARSPGTCTLITAPAIDGTVSMETTFDVTFDTNGGALSPISTTEIRPPLPDLYTCLPNRTFILPNLQENKAKIDKYRFPSAAKYIYDLGLDEKVTSVSRDVPIIATGSSSNHFPESIQMLNNLKEKLFDSYKDVQVYYYDLGLTEAQREQLKNFPRVHLRTLPFADFPDHVSRLLGYAWKPIIIQILLRQFGFVLWVDASVRFIYPNIDPIIQVAIKNGVAFRHGEGSLLSHTDIDTFRFLDEDPCNFKNYTEIEANVIAIYRTQFINDYLMKPVVLCALSYGCLVTENSAALKVCPDGIVPDHGCHRFDQSVFAIFLRRLFQNDPKYWIPNRESGVYVCRGPHKYVKLLPNSLNRLYAKFKVFISEENHARCAFGTKWYKPEIGEDY